MASTDHLSSQVSIDERQYVSVTDLLLTPGESDTALRATQDVHTARLHQSLVSICQVVLRRKDLTLPLTLPLSGSGDYRDRSRDSGPSGVAWGKMADSLFGAFIFSQLIYCFIAARKSSGSRGLSSKSFGNKGPFSWPQKRGKPNKPQWNITHKDPFSRNNHLFKCARPPPNNPNAVTNSSDQTAKYFGFSANRE